MDSKRVAADELITIIHLLKLKLVAKYGPGITKQWAPRVRSIGAMEDINL